MPSSTITSIQPPIQVATCVASSAKPLRDVAKQARRKSASAPKLQALPAVVLTPEEDVLLRCFRSVAEGEQRRIISTVVSVTAEFFPRHRVPALRLVSGGAA